MLVKSLLINKYISDYDKFIEDDEVLILIGSILFDSSERKMYFRSPKKYVEKMLLEVVIAIVVVMVESQEATAANARLLAVSN